MRNAILILALLGVLAAHAQRPDPDQQPYWTRYTFVEDSNVLVPLKGAYQVYYIQEGQYWSYLPPQYPVVPMLDDEVRMRRLFDATLPAFTATPARGKDAPDVKVVVVRALDTMVVELSVYYPPDPSYERPAIRAGERRPPVVIPFRKGRFLPTGSRCDRDYYSAEEGNSTVDARTVTLTKQFDALWKKAMKEEAVIPQLNTDTCRQEVAVPADLDLPGTKYRDAWVLRSPYCGTHLVHFPLWGTQTAYTITFHPYKSDQQKEPVTLDTDARDDVIYWLDISDWPIGDHTVQLIGDGNNGTFTLMLR
ncbi:MAG TPA: hypothetical protein PK760_05985, partial [Flavobacteriales bacterium]|nr:hypothetical protein [Flavobacteriales bacterium]